MVVLVSDQRGLRIGVRVLVIDRGLRALFSADVVLAELPLERILRDLRHALTYDLSVDSLGVGSLDVCSCVILALTPLDPLIDGPASVLVLALLDGVVIDRIFLIVELVELHFKTMGCDRAIERDHVGEFFLCSLVFAVGLLSPARLATRAWFVRTLLHERASLVVYTPILDSDDIAIDS